MPIPQVFPPVGFEDHVLLDSGDGQKLERFGEVTLVRPDPQALWRPRRDAEEWAKADLSFERESDRGGFWRPRRGLAPRFTREDAEWPVRYGAATFVVRPTPFKHVGLFPEQAPNWELVRSTVESLAATLGEAPRVLNLFGYTGAASVLAAQAGAAVTHVDASKASIAWTRSNAIASGLGERALRVLCDDALGFASREVRRGATYHVVLLDPPHYGRGPKGEVWRFEDGFAPLLEAVAQLVAVRALVVLSTYAIGYSPLAFMNVLAEHFAAAHGLEVAIEAGELAIPEAPVKGLPTRLLPAGFCARWSRGLPPLTEASVTSTSGPGRGANRP